MERAFSEVGPGAVGPGTYAQQVEKAAVLPTGPGEWFNGYGVMGAPFRSAHLLAMRRFVATSVGPSYTAVWHRNPRGEWAFYSTVSPTQSCPRYFGAAAAKVVATEIRVEWSSPFHLGVIMPTLSFHWEIELASTGATRFMTAAGRLLPDAAWRSPAVLGTMAAVAGPLLGAGRVGLRGRVPNGQRFIANPRLLWTIRETHARMQGEDFGPAGPLALQARLEDFWLPQRGMFAIGQAWFETFDPALHSSAGHNG
jgi:hypothetical protein